MLRLLAIVLVIAVAPLSPARAEPPPELVAAAESGDPAAQHRLGRLYERGEGTPQDDFAAVRWFRRAAENGHAEAALDLGWMLANGYGVAKDLPAAYRWIVRAALRGVPGAADLQRAYGRDLPESRRTKIESAVRDDLPGRAAASASGSAALPDLQAQRLDDIADLRRRYNAGEGAQVLPRVEALAKKGDPLAQNLWGLTLQRSTDPAHQARAVGWFLKAARQGLPAAQYNLAAAQLVGLAGAPDPNAAWRWLAAASANLGRPEFGDYDTVTREFRERAEYTDPYRAALQGYISAADELRQLIEAKRQEVRARIELSRRLRD